VLLRLSEELLADKRNKSRASPRVPIGQAAAASAALAAAGFEWALAGTTARAGRAKATRSAPGRTMGAAPNIGSRTDRRPAPCPHAPFGGERSRNSCRQGRMWGRRDAVARNPKKCSRVPKKAARLWRDENASDYLGAMRATPVRAQSSYEATAS
jgi:hypothetical protein